MTDQDYLFTQGGVYPSSVLLKGDLDPESRIGVDSLMNKTVQCTDGQTNCLSIVLSCQKDCST